MLHHFVRLQICFFHEYLNNFMMILHNEFLRERVVKPIQGNQNKKLIENNSDPIHLQLIKSKVYCDILKNPFEQHHSLISITDEELVSLIEADKMENENQINDLCDSAAIEIVPERGNVQLQQKSNPTFVKLFHQQTTGSALFLQWCSIYCLISSKFAIGVTIIMAIIVNALITFLLNYKRYQQIYSQQTQKTIVPEQQKDQQNSSSQIEASQNQLNQPCPELQLLYPQITHLPEINNQLQISDLSQNKAEASLQNDRSIRKIDQKYQSRIFFFLNKIDKQSKISLTLKQTLNKQLIEIQAIKIELQMLNEVTIIQRNLFVLNLKDDEQEDVIVMIEQEENHFQEENQQEFCNNDYLEFANDLGDYLKEIINSNHVIKKLKSLQSLVIDKLVQTHTNFLANTSHKQSKRVFVNHYSQIDFEF